MCVYFRFEYGSALARCIFSRWKKKKKVNTRWVDDESHRRLRKRATTAIMFLSIVEWNELFRGGIVCSTTWNDTPQSEPSAEPSTFDALFTLLFRYSFRWVFFFARAQEHNSNERRREWRTLNYCEHVWWWIDIWAELWFDVVSSYALFLSFSIVISSAQSNARNTPCVWLAASKKKKSVDDDDCPLQLPTIDTRSWHSQKKKKNQKAEKRSSKLAQNWLWYFPV